MKRYLVLFLIVLFGGILRFTALGSVPLSLVWDEVAFGYNAYALGTDGRDEFGVFLPYTHLESFGDTKPPLYAYLDILPIKVFGVNEFAVRFPSAFFGTLTILVTYFLTRRIFYNSRDREWYALSSAFILAISPWHINLSRAGFEANLAVFLVATGIWLFLEGVRRNSWLLPVSVIPLALSLYTFNTPRVVVPIMGVILIAAYAKILFKHLAPVVVSGLLVLLFVGPLVPFLLTPQARLRFEEVNIFSDPKIAVTINTETMNDHNALWSRALHNWRLAYAKEYLIHYFDNLNPSFLFIKADENRRISTQDVGILYIWEAVTLTLGLLVLFRRKEGEWWIVPVWLLVGIIPAATARDTPHALHIESSIPAFQILSAVGLVYIVKRLLSIRSPLLAKGAIVALGGFIVISVSYYLHGYYAHYPSLSAGDWQYGYKESVEYVQSVEKEYDVIAMTQKMGRPYIYYAFYMKIPPEKLRSEMLIHRDNFGFVRINKIGKYAFSEAYPKESGKRILRISIPEDVPKNAVIKKKFLLPDGYVRLVAYTL